MKANKLNSIIVLGLVATIGILIVQLLWTKEAFNLEEKKFSQKVHVALLEVVKKLYQGTNRDIPADNPVRKISNDYYVANVENDFSPDVLQHYLNEEFTKSAINTDYEYAMYNCQSDEMVYGKYISTNSNTPVDEQINFPKHKNLVYYFAIRFPNETSYLLNSLRFWLFLSIALIIILLVYVYSIYTIIQQKKYSELQRDFINNMTHEFKTPLSSILLASNYLSKQNCITEDEKLNNYTQIIINQSKKLNSHIEKILNIAKSDDSILSLEKKEISVIPILNEVIENMKLKHPTLAVTLNHGKEHTILADEFHFTNIVYNIIDNSVKYCNDTPEVTISINEEKNNLKLNFSDNGIGVSENNIAHLFDKFYRENNKKSNEINGFGLGLFYVKKICTQHHWKIFAANNPNKGLLISILIPKN
ncbi:HAMP domain-containing histidine kinase [Flavobacterium amnicola]|uniref:histidine kinase n=1 Tax=Flavobacterium amnicola TaxID=2506422 RepID=A0A4Q1K2A3_9FLAO|nr:HAMP domain-containing sensor histidine kinase [Flavobacterium amnicola]RXR18427.1 HAMP domain-containing histidine kinase [Flavobacterium amnicola]